jgi:TRAP-type uncharacterized transport system fused permease subunit
VVESPSVRELTARYGYHFSSLFVIVILMALGMTAFMAVFLSIVIAFALSFIRPETRMTSLRAVVPGAILTAILFVLSLTRQATRIFGDFDPLSWSGWKGMLVDLSLAIAPPAFWGMMLTAAVATGLVLRGRWQRRRGGPLTSSAAGASATGVGTAGHDATASAAETRLLQALESGGKGVLSVAATTATAGLIVSVVTLTGLGLKIAGIIVDLSGGTKLLTILFAALAVWVLGLAVPVTASYIIAAVMIVPALADPRFGVGVAPAAAHMFIFYYAVLADVSPPTALAPFAASAITGGNPFRTTMLAWKYCLPGFLVPIMFTLSPEGESLLLIGAPLTIAWTFITACFAVAALAIAFGGWIVQHANMVERVLAGLGGLALLYADTRIDMVGFALVLVACILHLARTRLSTASAPSKAA